MLLGSEELFDGTLEGVPFGGSVTIGSIDIDESIVVVTAGSMVLDAAIDTESSGDRGTAILEPPSRF